MTAQALYLSPLDAATELGCSTPTVLRAIARGHLPAVKYGRLIRIARADWDRWVDGLSTRRSA